MIRTKKTATSLGALCLAAAAAFAGAVPASAVQQGPAGILGIGSQITPVRDTGIYFGPGLSTPRIGTAWAGDNVAGICEVFDNNGKRLILGIERPGRTGVQWANTAGYLWADDFQSTGSFPSCSNYGHRLTPVRDTTVYSGPGLSTPAVGTAWTGDDVAGICRIADNNGKRLELIIERPGRNGVQWANSAGYVWDLDIREDTGPLLGDCGVA
ncbi:hypothetical protein ACFU6K_22100 [Kitasatospora sp. NPDC057512]|uniref:hypothetical protein n=1 Tax=Kitasatospora sp. NPDC057512 TaxID=3346154 RepID=UPI00369A23BB